MSSGYLHDVLHGARNISSTIVQWLIVVVGVLVVAALLRLIGRAIRALRPPATGIGIAIEEVSSDPAKRPDSNRALSRALSASILSGSQGAADEPRAEIDVAKDLDGGVTINVRVVGDELAALETYLQDGSPVKIGPISVSPRQLLAFLGMAFAPRYEYELRGYLAESADTGRFVGELRHTQAGRAWDGRAWRHRGWWRQLAKSREWRHRAWWREAWVCREDPQPVHWSSVFSGVGAREEAILDASRRLLFETGPNRISVSWPSVSAYREARAKLATSIGRGERSAMLDDVRRLLERSLALDPVNALARFELAGVLRKLGANEDAVAQYRFLETLPPECIAHPPSLPRAVSYSLALTLSKNERWEDHNDALAILDRVLEEVQSDRGLTDAKRETLLLQLRGARGAAKLFEAERFRGAADERTRERAAAVFQEISDARDWIKDSPRRLPEVDWTTYVQARAVAENAYGRAAYLNGRPEREVLEALGTALSFVPDLGDAHVNIASALLRSRARSPDWAQRIERHLALALEVSPRDRKALYLSGRLSYEIGRIDEARVAWTAAAQAGDARAELRLAQLLWDDGKQAEALESLRRLMASPAIQEDRAKLLIVWCGDLVKAGKPVRVVSLRAAVAAGRELQRIEGDRGKPLPRSLTDRLEQIKRRLGPTDGGEPPAALA